MKLSSLFLLLCFASSSFAATVCRVVEYGSFEFIEPTDDNLNDGAFKYSDAEVRGKFLITDSFEGDLPFSTGKFSIVDRKGFANNIEKREIFVLNGKKKIVTYFTAEQLNTDEASLGFVFPIDNTGKYGSVACQNEE